MIPELRKITAPMAKSRYTPRAVDVAPAKDPVRPLASARSACA